MSPLVQPVIIREPISDPIIAALTAERERLGLNRRQLGIRMGLKTDKSPWQWEHEVCSPSLANLRRWAGALGYDLALVPREERT